MVHSVRGDLEVRRALKFSAITTVQRDAMTAVPVDTVIRNSDTNQLERWDGATWGGLAAAADRVHVTDTALAPALSKAPTVTEVQAYVTANTVTGVLLYYTGTDVAVDDPTYVYDVDGSGVVTQLDEPNEIPVESFRTLDGVDSLAFATAAAAYQTIVHSAAGEIREITVNTSQDTVGNVARVDVYDGVGLGGTLLGSSLDFTASAPAGGGFVSANDVASFTAPINVTAGQTTSVTVTPVSGPNDLYWLLTDGSTLPPPMEASINPAVDFKFSIDVFGVAAASIYSADGTLAGARTVTMGGNDLTLSGAQDTILRDVGVHDAVAWRKVAGGGLFGAGTVQPDLAAASDFNWGIASSDVGDLTVNAPATSINGYANEYKLSFANTDTVARNIAFDAHYMDRDGTPLGTQVVAANSILIFDFTHQSGVFVGSYLDYVLPSASDVAATVIDSSAGAVAETLPAATGAGAIVFYATEDVTNTASLAPAAGEQLNGSVDGLFYFSNYAAGTQFRADDIAAGQWVVSVVGATSTTDPVQTAPLTELSSTSHTLTTGTTPASGQLAINSIRYIDEGSSFRRVYLDFYSFQDDQTVLQLGAAVVPATAAIRSAYAAHGNGSSAPNASDHRPSIYITGVNEITVNRDNADQAGVSPIGIVLLVEDSASTFSGGQTVLAGMVTPTPIGWANVQRNSSNAGVDALYTYTHTGDTNVNTVQPVGNRLQFTAGDSASSGITVGTNEVAIDTDGIYRLTASFHGGINAANANFFLQLVRNGTEVLDVKTFFQDVSTGNTAVTLSWVGQLSAADILDARTGCAVGGTFRVSSVEVTATQVPDSTVVMPDALVPTALHYASASWNVNHGSTPFDFSVVLANPGVSSVIDDPSGMIDIPNDQIIIPADGRYSISGWTAGNGAGVNDYPLFKLDGTDVTKADGNGGGSTGKAVGTFTATAGQVLTMTHSNSSVGAGFSLQQLADYSVVAWQPDQVEATALSRGTVLIDDTGTVTSPGVWVDIPTAAVTLPNVGTYELSYALSLSPTGAGQGFALRFADSAGNPVPGSANFANTGTTSNSKLVSAKTRVATAAAGEEYRLQWQTTTGGSRILGADVVPGTAESRVMWDQLPTLEVVTPGDVVPVDIGHHRFVLDAVNSASMSGAVAAVVFDSFTDTIGAGSIATFDGTDITVTAGVNDVELEALIHTAGTGTHSALTYFRDTADGIGIKLGDGVLTGPVSGRGVYGQGSDNIAATATIPAGTTVTLNVIHGGSANNQRAQIGSYIEVRELVGQQTVIPATDLVTNDQAASGYFDFGTMRMQWGVVPGTAALGDIVFPAAFADTGYSFVANVEAATTDQMFIVQHSVKATTQVHYDKVFHSNNVDAVPSGAITEPFSWQAIGVKP